MRQAGFVDINFAAQREATQSLGYTPTKTWMERMAMGTSMAKTSESRATFVLVHGAFAGGWVWRGVADRLRANGHRVFTPTLTGLGERSHLLSPEINLTTHVLDVVNLIKWEELSSIVLVGHSYGGMVVSGVTEKVADGTIRSIVFLDAAVPEDGKSAYDTFGNTQAPETYVHPPTVKPEGRPHTTPEDLDRLRRLLTPQSSACFTEKLHLTGARERIPVKTFIEALAKARPGPANPRIAEIKKDPAWRYETLDCGHNTMIELPDETTAAFERAASA